MCYLYIKNFSENFPSMENKLVFGFDLDNTIIKYETNTTTYKFMFPNVIDKMKELQKRFNLVIITNQKHSNNEIIIEKLKSLLEEFHRNKLYVAVYCSLIDDIYRKPNIGFKIIIEEEYKKKIFGFCGNSIGRLEDFSDVDLKFAINIGSRIFSPENIFLNQGASKDFICMLDYPIVNRLYYNYVHKLIKKEMVIMVGFPGAGKSLIARDIQNLGYTENLIYDIISRDQLSSMDKCMKYCNKLLNFGLNVIIDNTNPDVMSRQKFIKLGKKYGYTITCIELITDKEESLHNNYYRSFNFDEIFIPRIVYNIFESKYEEPREKEGFHNIYRTGINIYDHKYYYYYY